MNRIVLLLGIVSIGAGFSLTAGAVSLSVQLSYLEIKGAAREQLTTALTVKNPDRAVAVFEVYPDQFEKEISIQPESFILESGQSREVSLTVQFNEPGSYRTDVSVVSRPVAAASFQAAGGVKVPLTVTVTQQPASSFLASVADVLPGWPIGIAVGLTILWLIIKRSRR